jgi:DNA-binding transcriptional LysR family regulator
VTHRPEEEPEGGQFTFVSGVEAAVERALESAAGKDINVMGGAQVIRQALAAGIVDELTIIIAPVVLGAGKRLFEGDTQPLELEHRLRYFLAVVDEGGVTRAADHLHVAQPSLSQALRALEAELGVELFHRVGRGLRLSAAGEALIGPARQILRATDEARNAISGVLELRTGTLEIAALASLAADPMATLIGRFRERHPGVQFRVLEPESADGVRALVLDGACELGAAHLPLRGEQLTAHPLGEQELLFVLPREAAPELDRPLGARELARIPLVVSPPGTSTRMLLEQALGALVSRRRSRRKPPPARRSCRSYSPAPGRPCFPRRLRGKRSVAGLSCGAPDRRSPAPSASSTDGAPCLRRHAHSWRSPPVTSRLSYGWHGHAARTRRLTRAPSSDLQAQAWTVRCSSTTRWSNENPASSARLTGHVSATRRSRLT